MKRIFLLSTLIISSFGMMNLQTVSAAAPVQQAANPDPATFAKAKQFVSKVNKAVSLHGDQFSKVSQISNEYFQQLDALTKSNPSAADLIAKSSELKNTRNAKVKATLESNQMNSWASFKEKE